MKYLLKDTNQNNFKSNEELLNNIFQNILNDKINKKEILYLNNLLKEEISVNKKIVFPIMLLNSLIGIISFYNISVVFACLYVFLLGPTITVYLKYKMVKLFSLKIENINNFKNIISNFYKGTKLLDIKNKVEEKVIIDNFDKRYILKSTIEEIVKKYK